MEKLNKKEKLSVFIVILLYLGIALIITHGEYVFGSKTDWGFQHIAFPEYFRMLFYKNHDLFPDFAFNIGGGQNIYYFAYYGLLSPIILFSYLLPFIPMGTYIILSSLLLGVLAIYLFYIWIKGFKFSFGLNFILTVLFAMAGPLLFHSHRHIMFVNYMPFLLLGLIGVRRYFSNGYKGLMIISVFLMIMTSYYYSVSGILCMTAYGVYEYLKINDRFVLKDFIKKGFCFALLIITGVMMASIILLPVVYAILNGRGESFGSVSLASALVPGINLEFLLYDAYSVGLLGITFLAIVYLIFMKKENRFLGVLLSLMIICPIFVYILNGALYLDGKALIPFLPLYVLATGIFLKEVIDGRVNLKVVFLTIVISLTWLYLDENSLRFYFTLECIFILIIMYFYRRYKNKFIIFVPVLCASVLVCLIVNINDNLILSADYKKQNDHKISEIMDDIALSDDGVYRMAINLEASSEIVNHVFNINSNMVTLYSSTYNTAYNEFFYNFNNNRELRNMFITSETNNLLFEDYMGVKYLITDKEAPFGYKLWKDYGDYRVYINEDALSLGYATDRIIDEKDFDSLDFPNDVLALIGNVVKEGGSYEYEDMTEPVMIDLFEGKAKRISIKEYKDGYKVSSSKGGSLKLQLDENDKDKLYLLRFTVEKPQSCDLGDTSITVNGTQNKLTCRSWKYFNSNYTFDYTLAGGELNIEFSKGVHYIKKVELYSLDYSDFTSSLEVNSFDVKDVSGDKITGEILVSKPSYFHLTIPYDKGFTIKVDGEVTKYEKVNEAFIGFPISEGRHTIEIEYKAPNALLGKVISIVFSLIFVVILAFDFKKRKKIA